MNSYVYKWTDLGYDKGISPHKFYIGSKKYNSGSKIGIRGGSYICSQPLMLEQYDKRPNDFIKEILKEFETYEEARNYEAELLININAKCNILYYNRHNGNGKFFIKTHTEETKKKMCISQMGNKSGRGNKGKSKSQKFIEMDRLTHLNKHHSEETRKKLSKKRIGKNNPMYNKKHSLESIEKMKNVKKGKKLSENHRKSLSVAQKLRWQKRKVIDIVTDSVLHSSIIK